MGMRFLCGLFFAAIFYAAIFYAAIFKKYFIMTASSSREEVKMPS